jgi:hypothetical protein
MKQFNLETQAWEGVEEKAALNALSYLQSIYRNPMEPTSTRTRAAVEALPYENPRLSAVAVGYMTNDTFAEKLDRAIARSAPKLIEGRAEQVHD